MALDGANIAYAFGGHKHFRIDRLLVTLKYFLDLRHSDVTIFLGCRFNMTPREKEVTRALGSAGFLTSVE